VSVYVCFHKCERVYSECSAHTHTHTHTGGSALHEWEKDSKTNVWFDRMIDRTAHALSVDVDGKFVNENKLKALLWYVCVCVFKCVNV
jgi:hypothetical protein